MLWFKLPIANQPIIKLSTEFGTWNSLIQCLSWLTFTLRLPLWLMLMLMHGCGVHLSGLTEVLMYTMMCSWCELCAVLSCPLEKAPSVYVWLALLAPWRGWHAWGGRHGCQSNRHVALCQWDLHARHFGCCCCWCCCCCCCWTALRFTQRTHCCHDVCLCVCLLLFQQ